MYADDNVIYIHAKTKKATLKLNSTMENITIWLENSHMCLNVKKTVGMFFSKTHFASDCEHKVYVSSENIQVVSSTTKFFYYTKF